MRCKIHTFTRTTIGRNDYEVFRCTRCPYYISSKLAVGLPAICPSCGDAFRLSKIHLERRKALCDSCRKVKAKENPSAVEKALKSFESNLEVIISNEVKPSSS